MKSKIYRHKTFVSATIALKLGEEGFSANFKNGSVYPRKNGFFKTNDPKIQDAIEKHPRYNIDFFLEKVNGKYIADAGKAESIDISLKREYKELEAKYNKLIDDYNTLVAEHEVLIQRGIKPTKKVEKPTKKVEKPAETPKEIVVKNMQEAREILKGEPYNVPGNTMSGNTAINNRAKELGVEIKVVK